MKKIRESIMNFFGIFRKKKNVHNLRVAERSRDLFSEAAAATAFSDVGEHATARSMIDRTRGSRTILAVVQGDRFSPALDEYALEMARRLDFELLALYVTEAPLSLGGEKREKAVSAFREACLKNAHPMQRKAKKMGVALTCVTEYGNPDDVVARFHVHYPGMRYVLTEPDPEMVRSGTGRTAIPVIDLGCFQPAAV